MDQNIQETYTRRKDGYLKSRLWLNGFWLRWNWRTGKNVVIHPDSCFWLCFWNKRGTLRWRAESRIGRTLALTVTRSNSTTLNMRISVQKNLKIFTKQQKGRLCKKPLLDMGRGKSTQHHGSQFCCCCCCCCLFVLVSCLQTSPFLLLMLASAKMSSGSSTTVDVPGAVLVLLAAPATELPANKSSSSSSTWAMADFFFFVPDAKISSSSSNGGGSNKAGDTGFLSDCFTVDVNKSSSSVSIVDIGCFPAGIEEKMSSS